MLVPVKVAGIIVHNKEQDEHIPRLSLGACVLVERI